jgi:proline racemase
VSGQGFIGTLARMREDTAGVASRVKVEGVAYYSARSEFICERVDPFAFGFTLPARFGDL